MIIQPEKEIRNVGNLFYESEKRRIEMLNREFFQYVQLDEQENAVLVWLCGWDEWTMRAIISIFKKLRKSEGSTDG